MGRSFYPTRQGDLDAWEDNFTSKLSELVAVLNLTQPEVDEVVEQISIHRDAYVAMNLSKASAVQAVKDHELKKAETFEFLSKFIANIKTRKSYTESIGAVLGIVSTGNSASTKFVADKPELKVLMEGGAITIKFKKNGYDGIRLYGRRGSETEFTFLAIDTSSPYVDNRPNLNGAHEKREYHAFYLEKDEQVGAVSDVVSITI